MENFSETESQAMLRTIAGTLKINPNELCKQSAEDYCKEALECQQAKMCVDLYKRSGIDPKDLMRGYVLSSALLEDADEIDNIVRVMEEMLEHLRLAQRLMTTAKTMGL